MVGTLLWGVGVSWSCPVSVVLEDSRTRLNAVAQGLGRERKRMSRGGLGRTSVTSTSLRYVTFTAATSSLPSRDRCLGPTRLAVTTRSSSRFATAHLRWSRAVKATLCLMRRVAIAASTLHSGSPSVILAMGLTCSITDSPRSLGLSESLNNSPSPHVLPSRCFACGSPAVILAPQQTIVSGLRPSEEDSGPNGGDSWGVLTPYGGDLPPGPLAGGPKGGVWDPPWGGQKGGPGDPPWGPPWDPPPGGGPQGGPQGGVPRGVPGGPRGPVARPPCQGGLGGPSSGGLRPRFIGARLRRRQKIVDRIEGTQGRR